MITYLYTILEAYNSLSTIVQSTDDGLVGVSSLGSRFSLERLVGALADDCNRRDESGPVELGFEPFPSKSTELDRSGKAGACKS